MTTNDNRRQGPKRQAAVRVDPGGDWRLPNHWWSRICRRHFDALIEKYIDLGEDGMVLLAQEIVKKIAPTISDYFRIVNAPAGSPNAYTLSRIQWRVFDEFLTEASRREYSARRSAPEDFYDKRSSL